MQEKTPATARFRRPRRIADASFRELLGELAWRRLAPAVRERFAWKPAPGAAIRYVGMMNVVRASAAGWLMAQACRLLGTPLAPYRGSDVPVTVTLRLDGDGHGIVWERLYRFAGRAGSRRASCMSSMPISAAAGSASASPCATDCSARPCSRTASSPKRKELSHGPRDRDGGGTRQGRF